MAVYTPTRKRRTLPPIPNDTIDTWESGYMSYTDGIRGRANAFSDMLNMDLTQNAAATIRPGTVRYGIQSEHKIIGVGVFTKVSALTRPENWQIQMRNIDGTGKIFVSKDGGDWREVGGSFDPSAWVTFTQSNNRVYIVNEKNRLAFYDIANDEIITYTQLSKPGTPTVTQQGLSGTAITYRVRVTASNNVGETEASTARTITVSVPRAEWNPDTQSITIECNQVEGAESYSFYIGIQAGNEEYLGTIPKPDSPTAKVTYKDNNRVFLNPFRKAPEGNSTHGPIVGALIASDGALYGVRDKENAYRLWYSAGGRQSGDFSPFNGGGWVDINYGGDTVPTAVHAFRDGRGMPVLTILTKGGPNGGELYHMAFEDRAYGDFVITYPSVKKANGSSGTYSSMAVVEHNNSLIYPTARGFKTTGTKANMVNILVTNNITDTIVRDLGRLNLNAMSGAVGMSYENRVYFCLPVGSNKNSEIWVYDDSRRGAWILRWTLAADYMWLYEDSNGKVHHLVLVDNRVLEFDRTVGATDDGVPFRTRLSGMRRTFDKTGTQMAAIEQKVFALIRPKGNLQINVMGLSEDGDTSIGLAQETVTPEINATGWGGVEWSREEWGYELPPVDVSNTDFMPVAVDVDENVCQLDWEIVTESSDAAYTLHAEKTVGKIIPNWFYGEE